MRVTPTTCCRGAVKHKRFPSSGPRASRSFAAQTGKVSGRPGDFGYHDRVKMLPTISLFDVLALIQFSIICAASGAVRGRSPPSLLITTATPRTIGARVCPVFRVIPQKFIGPSIFSSVPL